MNFKSELHKIKAFVFDIDGVMTNCQGLMNESGEFLRSFNVKDGYALKYAVQRGYIIGVITGGDSFTVKYRFKQLKIKEEDVYLDSHEKIHDFEDFRKRYQLQYQEILYMGDDIPDIGIMKVCGMPVCPADAVPEVKEIAKYISLYNGGMGCVRDVMEQTMKVQNQWMIDGGIIKTKI